MDIFKNNVEGVVQEVCRECTEVWEGSGISFTPKKVAWNEKLERKVCFLYY